MKLQKLKTLVTSRETQFLLENPRVRDMLEDLVVDETPTFKWFLKEQGKRVHYFWNSGVFL